MADRTGRIRARLPGWVALGVAAALGTGAAHGEKKKHPELLTSAAYIPLRDAFVDRIAEDGFYCRLPAAAIVVADSPLFGQFERASNNIITPDWSQLTPAEQAVFTGLAGGDDTQAQKAQQIFDVEAHHWIFIVEEVHWWEACKQLTLKLTPYQAELQATRVALAYWRERDPGIVEKMVGIVAALDKEPTRVPPGQDFPTYFNQHFQRAASGNDYLWMQAQVVKAALADDPEPTLVETMKQLE